ncbi:glycosyltransferase [uncultured Lamprocystis sp.]|jgi:glycosyltransferase involved in cell wall biosynthesis|uniref:glycosyltransferase family protein n=1 Tax=uncultured Lamprocystis sp. TaxID=543132 RepID=UPI0025FE46D5|nr:glycosyltransferase [uncultured Lamprocystis sp.]
MKALVLSNTGFGHGSLYPFIHYHKELKSCFGLESTEIVNNGLQDKLQQARAFDGELLIISVPWDTDRHKLNDFYRELRRDCPGKKIVHFDYGDGNQSAFFGALPYLDLYLKQYLNTDPDDYRRRFLGGSKFIEHLVQVGMAEDSILSEIWTDLFQSELASEQESKLMLGWNFGLWKRMIYLAEGKPNLVLLGKDRPHAFAVAKAKAAVDAIRRRRHSIDVYCRATLYKGWTRKHREYTINTLNVLADKYQVVSSTARVSFSEYYREMAQSRIFVSPSGWCEYTPKDYEAMYFGALLMKPAVEHIRTEPDILVPNETYVPLKWDMSDMLDQCRYYLEHESERRRIVDNAREAYVGYYREKRLVGHIGNILQRLGLRD